ncbi:hypothetical protein Tco_0584447 [Tanacetum coccineum]
MSSQEQPSQVPITDSFTTSHPTQTPSPMPHDSPLSGGHTLGSDEGSKKLNELIELFGEEGQTFGSQAKIYHRKEKGKDGIFDDVEDLVLEDTSKQGRMTKTEYEEVEIDLNQTDDDFQRRSIIEEINLGKGFTLQQFTPTKVTQGEEQCQESFEAQLSVLSAAKILVDAS